MIPCQDCGNQNPLGTRYCRVCGTKIVVDKNRVFQAVSHDNEVSASKRFLDSGRSALLLGSFVLLCALVLRYSVVPDFPQSDVPPFVGTELIAPLAAPPPPAAPAALPALPAAPAGTLPALPGGLAPRP